MKKTAITFALIMAMMLPAPASASTLTDEQVGAITGLLYAFGVEQSVIDSVYRALRPGTITSQPQQDMPKKTTTPAPATPTTPETPAQPESKPQVASKAKMEVVSPIPGKGLGRDYKLMDQVKDESNYIVLGAVLYDDDGQPVRNQVVTVKVENKTGTEVIELGGTGNVMTMWVNGRKRQVPVYSIEYDFEVPGAHVFTFSGAGYEDAVTIEVRDK